MKSRDEITQRYAVGTEYHNNSRPPVLQYFYPKQSNLPKQTPQISKGSSTQAREGSKVEGRIKH